MAEYNKGGGVSFYGNGGGSGGSGSSSADNVSYDNTASGLEADNVQDAIDEVANAGGSGGVIVVEHINNGYLNKTWQEIFDATRAGKMVIIQYTEMELRTDVYMVAVVQYDSNVYHVYALTARPWAENPLAVMDYYTNTANGYPYYPD